MSTGVQVTKDTCLNRKQLIKWKVLKAQRVAKLEGMRYITRPWTQLTHLQSLKTSPRDCRVP